MKKLLLTGVAALLLATGAAHAAVKDDGFFEKDILRDKSTCACNHAQNIVHMEGLDTVIMCGLILTQKT
jgi:hypothetical protein